MHHVAVMKKSWGFTEKILAGGKVIESRWYMSRCSPWDRIAAGDTVYFKNAGEPVSVRAMVSRIIQFNGLTPTRIKNLIVRYGTGLGIARGERLKYINHFRDKKYGILIFLKNPARVRPFDVNKSGFGAMAAWMVVPKIQQITISVLG